MRKRTRRRLNAIAVFLAVAMLTAIPLEGSAQTRIAEIPPGYDLFVSDPAETHHVLQLPANFFAPGSNPFNEVVEFAGVPLETFMGFGVGDADTIVQRPEAANPNPTDTVEIELVALSLVSVQPIYVTGGAGCGQLWDVHTTVSPTKPSQGEMTINQNGTFDSRLEVYPYLTFTSLEGGCTRTLDGAELTPLSFEVANSFFDVFCELPALAVPGLNDGFCPGFDGEKHLIIHRGEFAQHGVWPAQPALEHFACYTLKKKAFEARRVELTDQFGSRVAEVTKRVELCNPAQKGNEPYNNDRAHLVCYTTTGPDLHTPVTVRNQFGSQQLMVGKPTRLCVPSRKKELDESLRKIKAPIDHFQCYAVSPLTPLYRAGSLGAVKLTDQFGVQNGVQVGNPVRLCAPVDKDGSRIEHPVAHLVCYQIEGARVDVRVLIKNQFERTKLVAKQANALCVPSAKVVLGR